MAFLDKLLRIGRRRKVPQRDTRPNPSYIPLGQLPSQLKRSIYKPTPRNLRMFGKFPYARRAINTIKNPIMELVWDVRPVDGVELNSELKRQIAVATAVLQKPNDQDDYHSFFQQIFEDMLFGAGAIEAQSAGDPERPLFMWPVDGLSISIFPAWNGSKTQPRYQQTMGYGGYQSDNRIIPLRDDELIYIKPNPSTSTPFGLGPMEVAFDAISRKLGVERYAGQVASNAGPPYGLDLGRKSMEFMLAFRKYWRDEIEGRGEIPIWADYTGDPRSDDRISAVNLKPADDKALYLAWQDLLVREIATSFDISPQNLGIEADVNRNTSEVAEDRDWDHAIKPWASFYARTMTAEVIQRRLGFSQLRFAFEGLDREDELATAEIYKLYYESNLTTPDEHRDKLGMKPMEGSWGDKTAADVEIAKAAARGMKIDLDPDLQPDGGKRPKPAPRKRGGPAKET